MHWLLASGLREDPCSGHGLTVHLPFSWRRRRYYLPRPSAGPAHGGLGPHRSLGIGRLKERKFSKTYWSEASSRVGGRPNVQNTGKEGNNSRSTRKKFGRNLRGLSRSTRAIPVDKGK